MVLPLNEGDVLVGDGDGVGVGVIVSNDSNV